VLTLLISLAGGLVAHFLRLPAGLLMGGALSVAIAAVAGFRPLMPDRLRDVGFVIVGMTLGTNVAADSLDLLQQWPITLIGLTLALILMVAISTLMLRYVFGFDKATAYLSSFPGHLSFVIGLSEAGYGNTRQIAVIQSMRILLLTTLVPIFARVTSAHDLSPLPTGAEMALLPLLLLTLAAIAGGFAFQFLSVPAAFVLGPMVVSTAAKLMGLYDGLMPTLLTAIGYVLMGALIGSRFAGATPTDLRRMAVAGTAMTLVCIGVVCGISGLATLFVDMPYGQIWLGLAPGALESMGALGIALGFDTAFIAAHHTARFFLLTLSIPTVALLMGRRAP
jgi:hypothetical protein